MIFALWAVAKALILTSDDQTFEMSYVHKNFVLQFLKCERLGSRLCKIKTSEFEKQKRSNLLCLDSPTCLLLPHPHPPRSPLRPRPASADTASVQHARASAGCRERRPCCWCTFPIFCRSQYDNVQVPAVSSMNIERCTI